MIIRKSQILSVAALLLLAACASSAGSPAGSPSALSAEVSQPAAPSSAEPSSEPTPEPTGTLEPDTVALVTVSELNLRAITRAVPRGKV